MQVQRANLPTRLAAVFLTVLDQPLLVVSTRLEGRRLKATKEIAAELQLAGTVFAVVRREELDAALARADRRVFGEGA